MRPDSSGRIDRLQGLRHRHETRITLPSRFESSCAQDAGDQPTAHPQKQMVERETWWGSL